MCTIFEAHTEITYPKRNMHNHYRLALAMDTYELYLTNYIVKKKKSKDSY